MTMQEDRMKILGDASLYKKSSPLSGTEARMIGIQERANQSSIDAFPKEAQDEIARLHTIISQTHGTVRELTSIMREMLSIMAAQSSKDEPK